MLDNHERDTDGGRVNKTMTSAPTTTCTFAIPTAASSSRISPGMPEERWLEALRPLNRIGRSRAMSTLGPDTIRRAMALNGQLILEGDAARARAFAAPPVQLPSGDLPSTGARRQVNFRLGAGEHARLVEAARVFGMRPNVLARLLTVRGVDRALHEARREP